jgi:carboxyl-terminal processing protease
MRRVLRPLSLFGVTSVLTLAAWRSPGDGSTVPSMATAVAADWSSTRYDFVQLSLLRKSLTMVEHQYVDPQRVDWERMFVEALESAERRVPVLMFTRDGDRLHAYVGDHRAVLQIAPLTSREAMLQQLQAVARLIAAHVGRADVPFDQTAERDPLAATDAFSEIEFAFTNGALGTLDPHSILLPPEASREMDVENQGEFGGLGITIHERNGRLAVDYPMPDSPAERAGMKSGDIIARIDGESTLNMDLDEAVGRLRGKIGSPVTVSVERDGVASFDVKIIRNKIALNEVKGQLLDSGYGFIRVPAFNDPCAAGVRERLSELEKESGGLKGLVLDLRDNPGGFLNRAFEIADTFLEEGDIVSTESPSPQHRDVKRARADNLAGNYPIVVLVSANSASASEIVAGALRNLGRAVIVGERTFGKGSVQNLQALDFDSKLKLTIAKYLTPGPRSIQSVGIPADVEMLPVVAKKDGDDVVAALYHRERVRREADLDEHFEQTDAGTEEPAYHLRYLVNERSERLNAPQYRPADDPQVRFARDLLASAAYQPGATNFPRRDDLLVAADSVVRSHRESSEKEIQAAFSAIGIDWRAGAPVGSASLEVRLDLGPDGVLVAGEEETIGIEVKNTGSTPIYRLSAIADDNEFLEGREFFFGALQPGKTKRYAQRVSLVAGYPTERSLASLSFRDVSGLEVARQTVPVSVVGQERAQLAWAWTINVPDGRVDVGDAVDVAFTVTNIGKGPATGATARLKNRSGRSIDLIRGTLEAGRVVDEKGAPCTAVEPGVDGGTLVGDRAAVIARMRASGAVVADDADPTSIAGAPTPTWPESCHRVLSAGESWTGTFRVSVKEALVAGYPLSLTVSEAQNYDHAAIVRSGFYSYFAEQDVVTLPFGEVEQAEVVRRPPVIELSRMPGVEATRDVLTLSGRALDDQGIASVVIFHGENKIFAEGAPRGAALQAVPFTVDVPLEPGVNTLSVLVTDGSGFTAARSVVTSWSPPTAAAATP